MSLIEEALRRIKDPLMTPQPQPTHKSPNARQNPLPAAHSWAAIPSDPALTRSTTSPPPQHLLVIVATAVIGLAAVLIMGGAMWMSRRLHGMAVSPPPPFPAPSVEANKPAGPQTTTPTEPIIGPVTPSRAVIPSEQDGFVLTGVIEGAGEPYAVINGAVVAVGERIGAATLLEITNGSVTLRRTDGSKLVLRVPR